MRTRGVALVVCLAALMLLAGPAAASMQRHDYANLASRRRLAQAFASASADARDGASVSSVANAVSNNGEPTSSVVTASGSGAGTVVDCRRAAVNGQQLSKECRDHGGSSSSCGKGWFDAPRCSSGAKETARDQQSCPWGFESGRPCAIRN